MKDPYSNVSAVTSLGPATRSANTTVNGTTVDRDQSGKQFQDALIVITTGVITDGTHTFEVQDSDDDSSWAAVADAYLQGTEPAIVAADDNVVRHVGYTGLKRYVRVSVTTAGATSGGIFSAHVVLTNPRVAPVR